MITKAFIYREAKSDKPKTLDYLRYGINPNKKDSKP